MGLIALVTGTGKANSTRLRLMQFHALPVPVTCAINPHIALSTVLLTIHSTLTAVYIPNIGPSVCTHSSFRGLYFNLGCKLQVLYLVLDLASILYIIHIIIFVYR